MIQRSSKIKKVTPYEVKKLLVFIGILIAIFWSIYIFQQAKDLHKQIDDNIQRETTGEDLAQKEVARIVDLVSVHIILPTETPTIYKVADPSQVKKSYGDFFMDASTGDHLLIYSGKAIIYREIEDVIVNVGPIAIKSNN